MLSVVFMVVFVMVFVVMMLGSWWVVWAALGGSARMNQLDRYALVGHFDKRPAKCLPESVRDLDTLLADTVETDAATARAMHLRALDHRLEFWMSLHELGDSRRLLDSMTKAKSFDVGFLDGTGNDDQSNGLGGNLGDSRNKYGRKDT